MHGFVRKIGLVQMGSVGRVSFTQEVFLKQVLKFLQSLKYYILVGSKGDKHMVKYKHFNQERTVQYYME